MTNFSEATKIQRTYYSDTARSYGRHHIDSGDEHQIALEYTSALMAMLHIESFLDVGTGTGRALDFLQGRHRGLSAVGVDPVRALLGEVGQAPNESRRALIMASAEALPFPDGAFDAVIATGVLHHVPKPPKVVAEMLRVARKAIFISDSNRFGQGSALARLAKLALCRAGAWDAFERLRTRGLGYHVSEGDGIAYSYSVFDSAPQVRQWADRVITIGTGHPASQFDWFDPFLSSSHVLLAGLREPRDDTWAGH